MIGRYTITNKDAVGPAKFIVSCDARSNTYRLGYASFLVRAAGGAGGSNATVAKNTTNRNDRSDGSQLPNRIDTGLGGTADDGDQGGRDPTRLLLPAGVLLIAVGTGLGLRQAARSRR
jgi:hypothetical protein